MARSFYERLTALDSSFLLLEKHNSPLHVASTLTIEAEPLRTEGGGIDAERIKKHMASELHRIPRYRQKLRWIPLTSRPVWVDDDRFNIDYHVRHTSLPRPGSDEQLEAPFGAHHGTAARSVSSALGDVDRRRSRR